MNTPIQPLQPMTAMRRLMLRAMTPKEFSDAIGGLLCPETIRDMCRDGRLKLARPGKPYLIDPSELKRFRGDISHLLIQVPA